MTAPSCAACGLQQSLAAPRCARCGAPLNGPVPQLWVPPTPQPAPNQPSVGEPPQETIWQRVRRRVIGPPESPH